MAGRWNKGEKHRWVRKTNIRHRKTRQDGTLWQEMFLGWKYRKVFPQIISILSQLLMLLSLYVSSCQYQQWWLDFRLTCHPDPSHTPPPWLFWNEKQQPHMITNKYRSPQWLVLELSINSYDPYQPSFPSWHRTMNILQSTRMRGLQTVPQKNGN